MRHDLVEGDQGGLATNACVADLARVRLAIAQGRKINDRSMSPPLSGSHVVPVLVRLRQFASASIHRMSHHELGPPLHQSWRRQTISKDPLVSGASQGGARGRPAAPPSPTYLRA
eukprot:6003667-Pyramimonas_sp.AAC.1